MPVATKSGICPSCDLEVDLKRGKIAVHPAPTKGRTAVECSGSGQPPKPSPVATDEPPNVLAPTLTDAVNEAARPEGAWAGAQAASLPPGVCDADPTNPRREVGDVSELALSLIARGMLEPVIVTPGPAEGRYTIVVGHRRIAAALAAQMPEVPALIRVDLRPGAPESLAAQVVENLQRVPMTPVEEARAYDLLREMGMKQNDIAAAVGVNQGQVSKRLALLKLPDDVAAKVGDGGLDVATAVEATRLPAGQVRDDALAQIAQGADPEKVVRQARQTVDRDAAHQAVIDTLEQAQVGLVDFPSSWHWGRDREDRPLATGPDGERQPYGGARTIDVAYADHAAEPCHGAAVSDRDEIVYVCLDPTRHGYRTAEQEAEDLETERAAADEAREAAQALAVAALQARRDAARETATADVKRPFMTDVVASWVVDRLALDPDVAEAGIEPLELLDRLVEWTPELADVDVTGPDLDAAIVARRVEALLEVHGSQKLAYMAAIAGADLLLDTPHYYRDSLAGGPIIGAHFARLAEITGYEPTDAERQLIEPAADPTVEAPDDEQPPDNAVAWYEPTADAAADGDYARWLTDSAELDAIIDAGFAHRLLLLSPDEPVDALDTAAVAAQEIPAAPDLSPGAEETDGENASDLAGSTIAEDLPADVAATLDAADRAAADVAHADDLGDRPTPGELCPASRHEFLNTPGNAVDIPCPKKCGALVSTTERGRVRDHDVPEPEAVEA